MLATAKRAEMIPKKMETLTHPMVAMYSSLSINVLSLNIKSTMFISCTLSPNPWFNLRVPSKRPKWTKPTDLLLEGRTARATTQYCVPMPPASKAKAKQVTKKVKKITDRSFKFMALNFLTIFHPFSQRKVQLKTTNLVGHTTFSERSQRWFCGGCMHCSQVGGGSNA